MTEFNWNITDTEPDTRTIQQISRENRRGITYVLATCKDARKEFRVIIVAGSTTAIAITQQGGHALSGQLSGNNINGAEYIPIRELKSVIFE